MKSKFKYFFIITITLLLSSKTIYSQWTISGDLPGMSGRPAVSVADENSAWVVGGPDGSPGIPVIYKTTNGGLNWLSVPSNGIRTNVACVYATDSLKCFVGDANSYNGYSRFYRTTNGGTNWTVADSIFDSGNGGFGAIKFSTSIPLFGIAIGGGPVDSVVLFKTHDGGFSWTKSQIPMYPGAGLPYSSLNVIDSLFYGFGTTGITPRANITTDGGVTWNSYDTGLPNSGGNFMRGLAFNNDKMTGIAASIVLPTIARTTNGGINWTNIDVGYNVSGGTVMRWIDGTNICYLSAQTGAAGAILKSNNGGLNWTQMTTAGSGVFNFDTKKIGYKIYGYAFASGSTVVLKMIDQLPVGQRFFGNRIGVTPREFVKGFLDTNASVSPIVETVDAFLGMEFDNTGKLYCIPYSTTPSLQIMDTLTGSLTNLGLITGITTPEQNFFSLSFNTTNNKMYMNAFVNAGGQVQSYLYTLDLNTRVATSIGTSGYNIMDIAITNSGQCYGIAVINQLISIDLTTGEHTLIGTLGGNSGNNVQSLCIDRENNILWLAAWNNDLMRSELKTVNMATGLATLVAPFNPAAGRVAGFTMPFSVMVGVQNISSAVPDRFSLEQNYPNPFNPVTKINYELQITNYVSLTVYDILGNEITKLVNEKQNAGSYSVDFNARDGQGSNLSSGVYFYKLDVNGFSETKSMILLK